LEGAHHEGRLGANPIGARCRTDEVVVEDDFPGAVGRGGNEIDFHGAEGAFARRRCERQEEHLDRRGAGGVEIVAHRRSAAIGIARLAEQRLVAASARIGVARAAFFPQIALTGYLGTEAASLGNLFTGPAGIWQFAGALAQPIFQGGRLFAETDAAEARQRQALAQYQKTVQTAFREVRDALNTQTRAREIYEAEGTRVDALREVLKLSYARYQAGLVNLLVPIDAERNLLQAQLLRINAFRQQRAAIADLFQALGGGWTAAEDAPTATSKSDQQAVSP